MVASLLERIKEDVRKYAEMVSNAIKVDVEIVDENMRKSCREQQGMKDQIGKTK